MPINEDNDSIGNSESLDIAKLTSELCFMTGCDQELAMTQLTNCKFDLQMAADKILESMPGNNQLDDGWQTINRQKKIKKKDNRNDGASSGSSVKQKPTSNRNSKSTNFKLGNYKTDDRQNYVGSRNKRNRNTGKLNDESEFQHKNGNTINSNVLLDLNDDELRWDNLADIDGALKASDTNSVVDCFYSDDDLGIPTQNNCDLYDEIGTQLIADVNNIFKIKVNNENYSKPAPLVKPKRATNESINSQPCSMDSKIVNECLAQQLPIFGKFSKTELPKSLPIIPNKPVSFALPLRLKNKIFKLQYNFGVNLSEISTTPNSLGINFAIPNDKSIPLTKQPDRENMYNFNTLENPMLTSNQPNFKNILMHSGISKQANYEGILSTIYQQQKEVAMLFGQPFSNQQFYSFKPVDLIPMSNGNQVYSMQMNPENLHTDIENGLTHQGQECFIQNSFPTSINISVPFNVARK